MKNVNRSRRGHQARTFPRGKGLGRLGWGGRMKKPRSRTNRNRGFDCSDPYGTRTRVTAVKGRCPRPLDEGAVLIAQVRERIGRSRRFSAPESSEFVKKTNQPRVNTRAAMPWLTWAVSNQEPVNPSSRSTVIYESCPKDYRHWWRTILRRGRRGEDPQNQRSLKRSLPDRVRGTGPGRSIETADAIGNVGPRRNQMAGRSRRESENAYGSTVGSPASILFWIAS